MPGKISARSSELMKRNEDRILVRRRSFFATRGRPLGSATKYILARPLAATSRRRHPG